MNNYKYIRGIGFVKKTDYYLYQLIKISIFSIFLMSSLCFTIIISLALCELLKNYLTNISYSYIFAFSLINIIGLSFLSIKEIMESWMNEAFESLKEKYKK